VDQLGLEGVLSAMVLGATPQPSGTPFPNFGFSVPLYGVLDPAQLCSGIGVPGSIQGYGIDIEDSNTVATHTFTSHTESNFEYGSKSMSQPYYGSGVCLVSIDMNSWFRVATSYMCR
jgi:hypothetical protein